MVVTATHRREQPWMWWLGMGTVGAVAATLRLVPVLLGGGLLGRGNYDDGVYFAAAVGLVHGLLPYRDVLLLHPPGILLALAPFAELGRWTGESAALAVARVSFMLLGATNAVLVGVALRRVGVVAAFTGGLLYAVIYPAVYVEHTTLLEPVATACVLGAIGIVASADRTGTGSVVRAVLAGVLLGAATAVKIWGVVPALVVVGWALVALGWRRAVLVLGGVVAGGAAICLPFFLAAPGPMWRLVVLAQLGRPGTGGDWLARLETILGMSFLSAGAGWTVAAALAVTVCGVAAWHCRVGRLAVLVLAATVGVLLLTPSWFVHYAAFSAGPLALVVGAGSGWAADRLRSRVIVAVMAVAAAGAYAPGVVTHPFGQPFPTAPLAAAVDASPGCVTADDPIAVIELDVLQRNLERGCPLVADLGGYNYALQIGVHPFQDRAHDARWQRYALAYLRTGDVTLTGVRFHSGYGFSKRTAAVVAGWPELGRSGAVTVRRPTAPTSAR